MLAAGTSRHRHPVRAAPRHRADDTHAQGGMNATGPSTESFGKFDRQLAMSLARLVGRRDPASTGISPRCQNLWLSGTSGSFVLTVCVYEGSIVVMRDIATAQLSGNLTRDVELRTLASGAAIARLRVASTTRRRQDDEWVDKTNYISVDVLGAQAQACAQHLSKGSRVFVEGELDWREWDDQHGKHREAVTLRARNVLFEDARSHNANGGPQPAGPAPAAASAPAATAAQQPSVATSTATAKDLPF
jgi:single-strand DNA-binding protein